MKIQTKLTGFFVIQLAVFSYLLIWLSTFSYKQELYRLNRAVAKERILNMMVVLQNHAVYAGEEDEGSRRVVQQRALDSIRRQYQEANAMAYPVIIDSRGRYLAHPEDEDTWLPLSRADVYGMVKAGSGEIRLPDGPHSRIIHFELFKPWDWLVGFSIPGESTFVSSLVFDANYRLAIAVLCGVGVVAGCLSLLLQKALSPLDLLVDSASDMAAGKFPEPGREKKYSNDEIGLLSRSFDDMAAKIKDSMEKLQTEIRERRKREHEIGELLENSPLPILIIRPDHTFTANNMFKDLFGWGQGEIGDISNWFANAVPREDGNEHPGAAVLRQMLNASQQSSHAVLPIRCRSGKRLDIDIHQKLIGTNNLLMFNDLTERKAAERKLRQTWSYLNLLFNSIRLLIIAVNDKGQITQWNQAMAWYSGIPAKNALRSKLWNAAPFMKPFRKDIEDAIAAGAIRELYRQTIEMSGEKYFNISITPLSDSETPGAVIILEDVTELIHKGEELIQAQKMETVGTLTGGLAHDFNNVLGGIRGSLSMMNFIIRNTPDKTGDLREYIELSEKSVARASNMVEQLLTLSRKSKLLVRPVNLRDAIENVLTLCRVSFDKSVIIKTCYSDVAPIVEADQTQIEQVLLNILINAEHAMTIMRSPDEPHGGVIEIRISRILPENMTHGQPGYYWAISIRDRGVGIAPELQMKIFDPFFTTKEKGNGSGLGLSMAYNIIHQHQGFIELKSEPGRGSEFIIYLPELFEHSGTTETELPAVEEIPGSGTVLIIDDEEAIRKTASGMLDGLGYTPVVARDGSEGLEIYRKRGREINLVLLDMVMPGLSGRDVYIKLKEINPQVKVLLSSGFFNDPRVNDVMAMGADGFLKKPYSALALSSALYRILGMRRKDADES